MDRNLLHKCGLFVCPTYLYRASQSEFYTIWNKVVALVQQEYISPSLELVCSQ